MAFHTITLQKIEDIADGTKFFSFTKPENFQFTAGQYVAMRITKLIAPDYKNGVRSLSLASAPCEDYLGFGLRQSESGFKATLWSLKPGDTVEVTDAVGFFVVPEEETQEIVFLIGGIGITPVRSILKQAAYEKSQKKYTLFFSNRAPKDAPFHEEIANLPLEHFKMIDVLSHCESGDPEDECTEHGFMRDELLTKHLAVPKECVYYLVGSPSFVEAMERMLDAFGVPHQNRHTDPFTGLVSAERK